ncbi:GDSL esterase/lipase At5g45910-like isoform X2 [Oryza brachyantha]|uniref:GDSL esterase/lipase At5g45910-like isoform X2 n=1 Tax=Oryza brachyantha TaxID=4533 RepID=UPI0003EAAB3C|nr:GDSL esterase/lipase At5g45910-like isoform X2 [Oryza brachyantha]
MAAARVVLVALAAASAMSVAVSGQKFNAIFSFGDSMSDTGNLCVNGPPAGLTLTQPPYGETFFGRATCRCSDGRLVVDFLAEKFGLPLLPPSKKGGSDFRRGANMAIIGATTMDSNFFQSLGIGDKIWNNGPLNTQIQWFQQLLPSVCGSSCKSYLSKSLFVLGEFGGNDYNAQLFGGYSPEQAAGQSATIVDAIGRGVDQLVSLGAMYVVVPGVLPVGCFPIYLTLYGTSNPGDYDQHGCLTRFNSLSVRHNSLLQSKVSSLQSKYPWARIMYADFYSHVYDMVKSPANYGFSTNLRACCGAGGGKYNYQNGARCGMAGAYACSNPSSSLSWDGIHLTEAAYKQIADGWVNGPYCHPPILS